MEILKMKNTVTELKEINKTLINDLNSRQERWRKESVNLKIKQIVVQSEQQRENRMKRN